MYLLWGGIPGPGDVPGPRWVPGPRGVPALGAYLVWGGVPGPGGCTWSEGCLPGTPSGPEQVHPPATDQVHPSRDQTRYTPRVDRQTPVNLLPWANFVAAGNKHFPSAGRIAAQKDKGRKHDGLKRDEEAAKETEENSDSTEVNKKSKRGAQDQNGGSP